MGIALIHVHCNQVTGSVTYYYAEHDEKQIPLKIDTVVTVFFQKPRVPVHLLVTDICVSFKKPRGLCAIYIYWTLHVRNSIKQ